ncbi:hypothetical protein [Polyangium fumosum]|uniref:Uncharacterized protein n=1 Tax=Polyangium fumosum TaxID=889272 RepID=A0A4V5PP78_9BACT|nr:hypothetical protein [Polyangium fumosum]TKD03101.1 hypothetical protein E8A74_27650 [Polyangium fumosum]
MKLHRSHSSFLALCFLAFCVPAFGCVGNADDPNDELVDEAESAFGETACGTDTASPDVTLTNSWPTPIYAWQHSGAPHYGDTVCTDAFRVVHQNLPTVGCTVKAKWDHDASVSLPGNQTDCEHSYVKVITYDGYGNPLGSGTRYGFWQSGAGVCTLPGSLLNPTPASATAYTAELAIAVAYVASCFNDPYTGRLICLRNQDGVQTLTSCP